MKNYIKKAIVAWSPSWKHSSTVNAVVINGKYDRVDWTISHESPQSSQGGNRDSNTGASRRDHGVGGEAGFCDRSVVKDGSLIKTQIVDRSTWSLLKTELIPGSYGVSNSSVTRASLLRTLGEHVRQVCDFLTISGWLVTITSLSTENSCNILYGYIKKIIVFIAIC